MKPKKSQQVAKPQTAQIEAIEQLAAQGEIMAAWRRIQSLRRSFPNYKGLHRLAFELTFSVDQTHLAALAAWDWTRASPESHDAWEGLFETTRNQYHALALTALRECQRLSGEAQTPLPPPEETPFGKLPIEEAVLLDLSRLMISDLRLAEGESFARQSNHPSAKNNRAICLFAHGKIPEALKVFEDNWQAEARNLFALKHLISLRLWQSGLDSALGLSAPLAASTPLRSEDAIAQQHGLQLLENFNAADQAYKNSLDADYWSLSNNQLRSEFLIRGAYAAFRLGNIQSAQDRLAQAKENSNSAEIRQQIDRMQKEIALSAIKNSHVEFWFNHALDWMPVSWLAPLRYLPAKQQETALSALLDSIDAHPDFLRIMAEQGQEKDRLMAFEILKHQTGRGLAQALAMLRHLLSCPCGNDSARLTLMDWLRSNNHLAPGETCDILLNGKVQNASPVHQMITTESEPDHPLPPEDQEIYEAYFAATTNTKDLDEAQKLIENLLTRQPENPMILIAVANIRRVMGIAKTQYLPLITKALAINPDYLFARTALAQYEVDIGNFAAALDWIKPLQTRETLHVSEIRSLMQVQIEALIGLGEYADAKSLAKSLKEINQQFS